METKKSFEKIEDIEFDGIDYSDYPDFCDAHITSATWNDGTPLTEAELDDLNFNHGDVVYDFLIKRLY